VKHRYALAGIIAVVIVSMALAGQSRMTSAGKAMLVRPEGYRDWISIGGSRADANVYMNPLGYRGYLETGHFPEGTVMVLESAGPGTRRLQASVKDARFEGGWGFFDFIDGSGQVKPRAVADVDTCRACHEAGADNDHVFTQFYAALSNIKG
jgi:hypothetical protein